MAPPKDAWYCFTCKHDARRTPVSGGLSFWECSNKSCLHYGKDGGEKAETAPKWVRPEVLDFKELAKIVPEKATEA